MECLPREVCPVEILTKDSWVGVLIFDYLCNFRVLTESFGKLLVQPSLRLCNLSSVCVTVSTVKGQKVVCISAILLNREDIKSVRQCVGPKLFLPLAEVNSLHGRNCVALLPFSEIVHMRSREKTHHLSL